MCRELRTTQDAEVTACVPLTNDVRGDAVVGAQQPARHIDHLVVVVPARNEGALVGRCLHSLVRARNAIPPSVSCSLVVVADRCTDDTVEIAHTILGVQSMVIDTNAGSVGRARKIGVQAALAHQRDDPARTWICSVDADSWVPDNWLTVHLDVALDAAAVAGIVELDDSADEELRQRFAAMYTLHPDLTHPHVHAANLGIRADVYLAAGGWRAHATGEEHDLWRRVRALTEPRSTTRLRVVTASRLSGRAPNGFADDLAALVVAAQAAA